MEKGEMLWAELEKSKDDSLRSYLCLALGLMNYQEASGKISAIAAENRGYPPLRMRAVTGLGLMGDANLVPLLIDLIENSDTLAVKASVAISLGRIGDARAVSPLLHVLGDKEENPMTRSYAAAASGLICDKDAKPWNSTVSINSNYRIPASTLASVMDML
ncbi:MAG: HEAT repeat domain-containing protein [Planctomycetes bacterium]|nr:HEAT repeat domain-containing protein [Planctomycetota bacterium]